MKKLSFISFFLFVFSFIFSLPTFAQNKVKNVIKLPVFMAGDIQIIDQPITGDLMVAANQVKIISDVDGDVYVAAGQVDISGTISGNLIAAGGNINLSGKVIKNIILAGAQIKVDTPAEINGYVLAGGGTIDLLGSFSGPVKVAAGNLILGEKAIINGNLEADVSNSDISSTSKVIGETKIQIYETKKIDKKTIDLSALGYIKDLFSFLSKLAFLLVFIKLFDKKLKSIKANNSFWSPLAVGFAVLVMTPILALILLTTVIGINLSFIISGIYFIALSLSRIITSILVGDFIFKKGYIKTNNQYLQGFIGLFLLTLFGLIPYFGGLIKFIALLFGMGIIFNTLKKYFSHR